MIIVQPSGGSLTSSHSISSVSSCAIPQTDTGPVTPQVITFHHSKVVQNFHIFLSNHCFTPKMSATFHNCPTCWNYNHHQHKPPSSSPWSVSSQASWWSTSYIPSSSSWSSSTSADPWYWSVPPPPPARTQPAQLRVKVETKTCKKIRLLWNYSLKIDPTNLLWKWWHGWKQNRMSSGSSQRQRGARASLQVPSIGIVIAHHWVILQNLEHSVCFPIHTYPPRSRLTFATGWENKDRNLLLLSTILEQALNITL